MILSLTGPSGVGKTTLLNGLLANVPGAQPLESTTTRAARPSDEAAFVYIDDETFFAMQEHGEFLWTAHPHGKHYGTRKAVVDAALNNGIFIPILVISAVQTLHTYAKTLNKETFVRSLYIELDDEAELRKRFAERNDMTATEIEDRIQECRSWNSEARASGIPFLFLDGNGSREELLATALQFLRQ